MVHEIITPTLLHAFTGVATIASCIAIVPTSCHGTDKLMWHVLINSWSTDVWKAKKCICCSGIADRQHRFMASNTTLDLLHNISIPYLKDKLYKLDEIFLWLIMKRWRCHINIIVTKLFQLLFNILVSSAPLVLDFCWCMVELRTKCFHECMALNECQSMCLFEEMQEMHETLT